MVDDLWLLLSGGVLWHRGEPSRGDVVTFSSPQDGARLIERVVGLPGDEVALRGALAAALGALRSAAVST